MRIITNTDIYYGRENLEAVKNKEPDPKYGFCDPITLDGDTEPLCVPVDTAVTKLDGSEFNSKEEFLEELNGNGYYKFDVSEEKSEKIEKALAAANIPFCDEHDFAYLIG